MFFRVFSFPRPTFQYIIGNIVVGCVLAGLACIGFSGLGLYAAARKKILLLRVYGFLAVCCIILCLGGIARGLVGAMGAAATVSRMVTTPRPRSEVQSGLETFYYGYDIPLV